MASPAQQASVSGPFGSAADLAIFSTPTMTRRVDPGRASETAAISSMARTCSGPRRPNQDPPKLHAVHSPHTSEGDVLTRIRVLLPKQPSPASPPSGQRRWRSTSPCLLSPSAWAGGCFLFPAKRTG
ncbi:hypothetical protein VPH35_115262 [Triticum aestivum]